MKKIIVCISLIYAMSAGMTALATTPEALEYDSTENQTAMVDASAYKTVLIQNDEDGAIVYANQEDGYFSSAAQFLLQENPDVGTYTVTLGGGAGENKQYKLIVDDGIVPVTVAATPMGKQDNGNGTYDLGCKIEGVETSNCKWFVITSTRGEVTKTLYLEPDTAFTGTGAIDIGIRINNILEGVEVTVGISNTNAAN